MWIQIIGPAGSGKGMVTDILKGEGYEDLTTPLVDNSDIFIQELTISQDRLKSQLLAAEVMSRKDVFTVRSFWDSHEVMIPVARSFEQINDFEMEVFSRIYGTFKGTRFLIPPNAVIYMKMPLMSAYNRMLLRNVDINQDQYNAQVAAYDEYAKRICIPVLEIDGSAVPEKIKRELDFNIASVKSTHSSGNIWQKEYMR